MPLKASKTCILNGGKSLQKRKKKTTKNHAKAETKLLSAHPQILVKKAQRDQRQVVICDKQMGRHREVCQWEEPRGLDLGSRIF